MMEMESSNSSPTEAWNQRIRLDSMDGRLEVAHPSIHSWYAQLEQVKAHLVTVDPVLGPIFEYVDGTGFRLHTSYKEPYPALVAAIIGQKIRYTAAKQLRGQFYSRYGNNFTPRQIQHQDLSFLGPVPATIIANVTNHIIAHQLSLGTEAEIRSLSCISGIGPWTVETTLITCLQNWDLFPCGDKFLQNKIRQFYHSADLVTISSKWAPYRSLVTWYLWRYL